MPIKILVSGAFGRMGRFSVEAFNQDNQFKLVGQTGRGYDLKQAIKDSEADVVLDFTHPETVYHNALTIIEAGARPVIGTSGLKQEQILSLQDQCKTKHLGGIIAPNFSLGAVLMMKYACEIVKYLPHVEIIEMHHEEKVDSPSGTALRSAEILAKHGAKKANVPGQTRETLPSARGAEAYGIPIHSIRLPGLIARQDILFGGTGETLTLSHNCIDRQCFMPGVRFACKKVMELEHLIIGLENLL